MENPTLIGISAVTGGGKTHLTEALTRALDDATSVYFDDFDESTKHPPDLKVWLANGADYNAWQTPELVNHLKRLKEGEQTNNNRHTLKFVVFDAPLGRAHEATGRYIDYMVFLNTPLDIAMARRLLRDGLTEESETRLQAYLDWARELFLVQTDQVSATADLVLDGTLPIDVLTQKIMAELKLDLERKT